MGCLRDHPLDSAYPISGRWMRREDCRPSSPELLHPLPQRGRRAWIEPRLRHGEESEAIRLELLRPAVGSHQPKLHPDPEQCCDLARKLDLADLQQKLINCRPQCRSVSAETRSRECSACR